MCTSSPPPDQRRADADTWHRARASRQEKDRDRRGIIFRRLTAALRPLLGPSSAA